MFRYFGSIRSKINKLKNNIKKRLKFLTAEKADAIAKQITNTDETRRMFEAVRLLSNTKRKTSVGIHDELGELIVTDEGKAEAARRWFKEQFDKG